MRIGCLFVFTFMALGCAAATYTSQRSAQEVSDCIAKGWRHVSASGANLPVVITKEKDYLRVEVVLVRDFPTFLPMRSLWAQIRPLAAGSTTEYHRNFQIWHRKIDSVVMDCQEVGDQ